MINNVREFRYLTLGVCLMNASSGEYVRPGFGECLKHASEYRHGNRRSQIKVAAPGLGYL